MQPSEFWRLSVSEMQALSAFMHDYLEAQRNAAEEE